MRKIYSQYNTSRNKIQLSWSILVKFSDNVADGYTPMSPAFGSVLITVTTIPKKCLRDSQLKFYIRVYKGN